MSYRVKLLTAKASTFAISVKANNRKEATSLVRDMYPNHEIISVEPGRVHQFPWSN